MFGAAGWSGGAALTLLTIWAAFAATETTNPPAAQQLAFYGFILFAALAAVSFVAGSVSWLRRRGATVPVGNAVGRDAVTSHYQQGGQTAHTVNNNHTIIYPPPAALPSLANQRELIIAMTEYKNALIDVMLEELVYEDAEKGHGLSLAVAGEDLDKARDNERRTLRELERQTNVAAAADSPVGIKLEEWHRAVIAQLGSEYWDSAVQRSRVRREINRLTTEAIAWIHKLGKAETHDS